MKYERFEKIVLELQEQDKVLTQLNDHNIDLANFIDPYFVIINELIQEIYGDEGYDWFSWFCWENDFGEGDLDAYDGDEPICYSVSSLWQYLEENHNKINLYAAE